MSVLIVSACMQKMSTGPLVRLGAVACGPSNTRKELNAAQLLLWLYELKLLNISHNVSFL